MSGYDSVKRNVLRRVRKVVGDGADVTSNCRPYQCSAANSGAMNWRLDEAVAMNIAVMPPQKLSYKTHAWKSHTELAMKQLSGNMILWITKSREMLEVYHRNHYCKLQ